ncbi:MAG: hypothetical protein M0P39_09440 [Rhodocyclaceae bacterium]|jgi:type IV secretory pathway component VirB8|nr:hypothetical protein [Rhodocyclaceae bacterium]
MSDDYIARVVRRQVGIAALRRIRTLVDAEASLDEKNRRWAKRLAVVFIVIAVVALTWIAVRFAH